MTDFNQPLAIDIKAIQYSIELLHQQGSGDAVSNYLYFLRDAVNVEIKLENHRLKTEAKAKAKALKERSAYLAEQRHLNAIQWGV